MNDYNIMSELDILLHIVDKMSTIIDCSPIDDITKFKIKCEIAEIDKSRRTIEELVMKSLSSDLFKKTN